MTTPSIESLVVLLKQLAESGAANRGWEASLSERVRDLLRSRDSDLKGAASAVRKAARAMLNHLPADVRDDVLNPGTPKHVATKQAYRMGQLDLAHLLIAQASTRRVDAEFRETLANPTYRRLLQEIYDGECSTFELAERVNRSPEQTSRNLSVLRKAGISDFRRVSKQVLNFLTPAARHAFGKLIEEEDAPFVKEVREFKRETSRALKKVREHVDPTYNVRPVFKPAPSLVSSD